MTPEHLKETEDWLKTYAAKRARGLSAPKMLDPHKEARFLADISRRRELSQKAGEGLRKQDARGVRFGDWFRFIVFKWPKPHASLSFAIAVLLLTSAGVIYSIAQIRNGSRKIPVVVNTAPNARPG